MFPTLVPCPPFCEPFNLKETVINDAFDPVTFFFFPLKGSLFLFYINLMLEVNHEYKNYIAYLFLGALGLYKRSLPPTRKL